MKKLLAAIAAAIGIATGAFAEVIDLSDPAVAIDVLTLRQKSVINFDTWLQTLYCPILLFQVFH